MAMEPPAVPLHARPPWRVVIIGASYAGLSAAANLLDLCTGRPARFSCPFPENHQRQTDIPVQIIILDERDGFFHTVGAPLALADPKYASKFWTLTHDIPGLKHPWVTFIHGSACAVDVQGKKLTLLASGSAKRSSLQYSYLIVASGLRRPWPVVPQSLRKLDYENEAVGHVERLKEGGEIVVIGGGAVGVGIAAEIHHTYPDAQVTLIHSRDKLLSSEPLPDQFKNQVLATLQGTGVDVIMSTPVLDVYTATTNAEERQILKLSNSVQLEASYVIKATSKPVPSTSFLPREVLNDEGYVPVAPTLRFGRGSNSDSHYAIGDVNNIPGIKRCSTAMQMGHYAAVNIHQQLLQCTTNATPQFLTLNERCPGIGLAVGDTGLYWTPDDGIVKGKEALLEMFNDDLGWSNCWNYMQLGKPLD